MAKSTKYPPVLGNNKNHYSYPPKIGGEASPGSPEQAARCAKVTGKVSGPGAKAFASNLPSRHGDVKPGPVKWKWQDSDK
jgi:hypothetical protein